MYIYIDESGVVTKGQGDYFIVTALCTPDKNTADRCIKNIRQNHLKKHYKNLGEIKFSNSTPEIIRRILQCITRHDIKIYYCAYKKELTEKSQIELKINLFSRLIKMTAEDENEPARIIIDNFLKKTQQNLFSEQIQPANKNYPVTYSDSISCPGIQLADFLCGTIGRYYNYPGFEENIEHYNIIKNKIKNYR
ncbi:MAG TPA: DUF3800 domain-containing protein [Methanocorpusculum sp.]|nr:DUF3800 domain-containing protein [Methanocorpusculum sp.]